MLLTTTNFHPRDAAITFKEEGHEYTISGKDRKPTSVTTLIHKFFPEFDADAVITKMMRSRNWPQSKYYGRTRESIKEQWERTREEAAQLGTKMHRSIELFLNMELVDDATTKQFTMFMQFWTDFRKQYPMIYVYRTEWLVYDETTPNPLAGSIDCVVSDGAGNLIILDWKCSKEIKMSNSYQKGNHPFNEYEDCNFNHYCLQLNFYRHILETKYDKNVIFMMLVILHPNQESYICHAVPKIELTHIWHTINS